MNQSKFLLCSNFFQSFVATFLPQHVQASSTQLVLMDALQQYILCLVGDDVLGSTAQELRVVIQQFDRVVIQQFDPNVVMRTRATLCHQLHQLVVQNSTQVRLRNCFFWRTTVCCSM
jgi:hypothetical protein